MVRLLRFFVAAAAALAIWWSCSAVYNQMLCAAIRPLGVHATEKERAIIVSRIDAPTITVPAAELTYNIVLFAGLVAAWPPRRIGRTVVALIVLLALHIPALLVTIEATYERYSADPNNFWIAAEFIYRLAGMFAIAFACWFIASERISRAESPPRRSGSRTSPRSSES